ncbi:hypothetical protein ACS75_20705 [Bacillus thuringiensis]|nr:hypothetical protein ACS75_20705 [Bacillus thuringiensis]
MHKKMSSFILYSVLNIIMYLIAYFVVIKPMINTTTNIEYTSLSSIIFVLILIVVGVIFGFFIKRIISHKSSQENLFTNEITLYIFSHILILPILLLIAFS